MSPLQWDKPGTALLEQTSGLSMSQQCALAAQPVGWGKPSSPPPQYLIDQNNSARSKKQLSSISPSTWNNQRIWTFGWLTSWKEVRGIPESLTPLTEMFPAPKHPCVLPSLYKAIVKSKWLLIRKATWRKREGHRHYSWNSKFIS